MKKVLLFLLVPLILFSCVTQERVERAVLIAHAGGEIDSCIYTNSREALEQAVVRGYSFIEFDFQFTSDSVLVAAHSWSDFNKMTGYAHKGDSAPSFNEFKSRRIYKRYTPLSASEINRFFEQRSDIYLVTDKVSQPEVLACYFPNLKSRIVVEAFSYPHYKQLKREGYFRVLYSCMAADLSATMVKHMLFHRLFRGERVEWVALHTSGFDNSMFRFIDKLRLFNVALFTIDNIGDIPPEYAGRAKMIYTNFLQP